MKKKNESRKSLYKRNKEKIEQFKNEIVDYVFDSEKNFFDDWIDDHCHPYENDCESFLEFKTMVENHIYVKCYYVIYGKIETEKMIKEKWKDLEIDHQLICEL